jgi:2-hydroxy-4-carboxymuconate semialdehyde hemiacetal dehydrogenase
MDLQVAVIGGGEIARRHLRAFAEIDGARVSWLVEPNSERAVALARTWTIPHVSGELDDVLADPGVDAVVVATPTQLHPDHAARVLATDKHLLLEIPMGESIGDAERIAAAARPGRRVTLVAHSRRFGPNHRWMSERFRRGELRLQHLEVRADFFRRTNKNAAGEPREWVDNLLWHHATHTVDLFRAQTGEEITKVTAIAGPVDPRLGTIMDLGVGLSTASGILCTLSMSFNSESPQLSEYRYLCDHGTFIASGDTLRTGNGEPITLAGVKAADGVHAETAIEAQDREFVAAIREGRPSVLPVDEALATMRVVQRIEEALSKP